MCYALGMSHLTTTCQGGETNRAERLAALLADGNRRPRAELAEALGVSRSTVHRTLRELGEPSREARREARFRKVAALLDADPALTLEAQAVACGVTLRTASRDRAIVLARRAAAAPDTPDSPARS